jgi:hypothetical protein
LRRRKILLYKKYFEEFSFNENGLGKIEINVGARGHHISDTKGEDLSLYGDRVTKLVSW